MDPSDDCTSWQGILVRELPGLSSTASTAESEWINQSPILKDRIVIATTKHIEIKLNKLN